MIDFGTDAADAPVRMTAHEWVRDRLRRAIFTGEYAPGARLVQTDIAEQFGVSVTPVREAMRDLINEGMIRFDPHKAARVRDFQLNEAIEIHDLRLLLEPEAVRRAATRLSDSQVTELERLQDQMAGAEVDGPQWMELNHQWHDLVIEAAGAPRLAEILRNLRLVSRFYLAASLRVGGGNRDKSSSDHLEMIAAFRRRDADKAASIMRVHLPSSEEIRHRFEAHGLVSDEA